MIRNIVAAAASAALCMLSATPAMAQQYRFNGFDAPRGAAASLNLRVPLGREKAGAASYGLTLGYGRTMGAPGVDGRTISRAINFADFRFAGGEMRSARVASFDLARLDQDRRLNLAGGGKKTWLVIGAIVVAGVVICVAADCFEDDDSDSVSESPGS